jgi:hypothetical protein
MKASCTMTGAPSFVPVDQLDEVHITQMRYKEQAEESTETEG